MSRAVSVRAVLAPRMWGYHLLVLVLAGAAVGLAAWQYAAWQEQRALAARDLSRDEPRPLDSVLGPDERFPGEDVGRPVRLSGSWQQQGTVLVSGREQDGREGYWVVTPVVTRGNDAAIPVVRGWVPGPAAAPAAPTGPVSLTGVVQPSEGSGEVDPDPDDRVLPQLRIASLLERVGRDLYGGYVIATGGTGEEGLTPADPAQLPDPGRLTAWRNLAYALEWLVFGGFAVYLWWTFVRDEARERAGGGESRAAR